MGKFSAEQSCREFYVRLSTLRLVEAFAVTQKCSHFTVFTLVLSAISVSQNTFDNVKISSCHD